ncbi:MAG: AbgT family transporter [Thermoanaerobaculia bacterium]|nr:MAG: AbgT family transporter [Thermoanaerobaculia bacterium]
MSASPAPAPRPPRRSSIDRFLTGVERVGNALPHPATLFALFALGVVLLSALAARLGVAATHPVTGETVHAVSLLSIEGLHRILLGVVTNFTGFAPLGTVLVALIGIGICESSGLIGAVLRLLVLGAPRRLLTLVIVFTGVMSNAASEVGYVLLVPLAGIIFQAVGRHPVVGMAAAFAGVSGGFSANLLLGTVDPLLAGLTQEAAHIVLPGYLVNPACNYYFMVASTFLITALGTLVTERVVAPRFGAYRGEVAPPELERLKPEERRGLRFALVALLAASAVGLWGLLPGDGFLREAATGSIVHSPFLGGIVTVICLTGTLLGVAYGVGAGTVKRDTDVIKGMSQQMSTMGGYLVLVFFAAQFVAFFNWTKLGLIVAVKGAGLLERAGLHEMPLLLAFILLAAALNLAMGSASAKWAVMAPVFVPMFALLGYSPELTQAAYRVGDSVTNVISPMMSYFALIIAFVQKYEPRSGLGTVVATMLPYTVVFLVGWSLLFAGWLLLELPLGPGAPMFLTGEFAAPAR